MASDSASAEATSHRIDGGSSLPRPVPLFSSAFRDLFP